MLCVDWCRTDPDGTLGREGEIPAAGAGEQDRSSGSALRLRLRRRASSWRLRMACGLLMGVWMTM